LPTSLTILMIFFIRIFCFKKAEACFMIF